MFEDTTVEGIKNRILGRISTDLQTREGSFINDAVSAAAAEISECYHSMDAMLPAFYLDETSGGYIDKQASVVGIVRKSGSRAKCAITFTGTDGASVPTGTPFYTASGLAFYLDETVTISAGIGSGSLIAAQVGDDYNIGAGEIVSTLRNYSGIESYTNGKASGGTDQESDSALLARYLDRRRRPPTSGNPYHYQSWATSVDGIGAARVFSKWDGPGTVKVVLADMAMRPIESEDTVSACAAYIENQRPVGPAVTVAAAQAEPLAVTAVITIDGTTTKETVRTELETAVTKYLQELVRDAFSDNVDLQLETMESKSYTVLYNRIAFLLLSISGVVDYTELKVAGGTKNITIAADKLPVLTGVTVQ